MNYVDEQGAWKKVTLLFNGAIPGAPLCLCYFCGGFSVACIEAPYFLYTQQKIRI